MRRPRIGRRGDPRCQGQARPGRGIDVGEDRRRPAYGPRPCRVRRRRCERIPPAAVGPPERAGARATRRTAPRPRPPRPPGRLRGVDSRPALGSSLNGRGAAPARTVPLRSPIARARPTGVSPAPRDARRQPDQGPGPRHDPVRVVAATARREPSTPGVPVRERVDEPRRSADARSS